MAIFSLAGLALGLIMSPPIGEPEHRVRIDHVSGPVDAEYRPSLRIATRQIGTAASPGKPSTLACAWRAGLTVDRHARSTSGASFRRSIDRDGVIEGRRAGWCSTHRAAIGREVARRSGTVRGHLTDVAQEDHPVLRKELDHAHRKTAG